VMTLQGTVNKTVILLALLGIGGAFGWQAYLTNPGLSMALMWAGALGGLVTAMIIVFNKTDAPMLSPVYAILEGLALGAVSAMYDQAYHGIAVQAVGLTLATLVTLLAVYSTGLIKPSENFKLGVIAATGGIAVVYLIDIIGMFVGGWRVPFINDYGPIGIAFSVFVCGIAALNLVLDFDFIETGVENKAPKFMEWYGAFGLLVTLVWLYLEILRLLAKLRKR
jgi:uncharacterized YccA/Bax inhibitor family protein